MKSNIEPFAASAAALVASHVVSDSIWRKHIPELPPARPELRIILIRLHHAALDDKPLNKGDAELMIVNEFQVADNTASKWLKILERELGLIIRQPGTKQTEIRLVPSTETKASLHKVGLEYLACGRLVFQVLSEAVKLAQLPEVEHADEVRDILRTPVVDYATDRGVKERSKK